MNPPRDQSQNEESILSPDELQLSEKEDVVEIEDGRYVVSTDGSKPDIPEKPVSGGKESQQQTDIDQNHQPETTGGVGKVDIKPQIEAKLQDMPTEFGYQISVNYGKSIKHHQQYRDNIAVTFSDLIKWYAKNLDSEMNPEEVLGILLLESDITIRYPMESFEQYLVNNGLSADDTIADLLVAVRKNEGFKFPPEK